MEGSHPAAPAEPGTLKTSLVATPGPVLTAGGGLWKVTARVGVEVSGEPGRASWLGELGLHAGQGGESDTASLKWREVGDLWGGSVQRCSRRGAGGGVLTAPSPTPRH